MPTYPLPTLAAQVTSTGISAPSYADILASLKATYHNIYGPDAYLEEDSQDGQLLAAFAQAINDVNNTAIAVYLSFSPATAQGAGLASVVKINGLTKLIPTNSTIDVLLAGVVGTTIINGIVQDPNGNKWDLPASVTIPIGGSIIETATCETKGAIALGNSISLSIVTPTLGWQSATTNSAANPGHPTETDAALRQRQAISTELPSQSIIGGIYGTLANLAGVVLLKIYENDTGSADGNGIPGHSISVVIQGGDSVAIAQAIEEKKTPGTGTYGTTTEIVTDPIGVPVAINFYRPTQVIIDINITIKALAGYVSSTGVALTAAEAAAINAEGIGANNGLLSLSALESECYDIPLANTFNVTAFTMARHPASPTAADITIAFNEIPVAGTINLTVT